MVVRLDDARIRVILDVDKLDKDLDEADKRLDKRRRERDRDRGKRPKDRRGFGFKRGAIAGISVVALIELMERVVLPAAIASIKEVLKGNNVTIAGVGIKFDEIFQSALDKLFSASSAALDRIIDEVFSQLEGRGLDQEVLDDLKDISNQMRRAGLIGSVKGLAGTLSDMREFVKTSTLLGTLPGVETVAQIGLQTAKNRLAQEEVDKAIQQRTWAQFSREMTKYFKGSASQ